MMLAKTGGLGDKVKNEKFFRRIKLDGILTLSLTALCNLSYLSDLGLI
jgi:hypothetical protein